MKKEINEEELKRVVGGNSYDDCMSNCCKMADDLDYCRNICSGN